MPGARWLLLSLLAFTLSAYADAPWLLELRIQHSVAYVPARTTAQALGCTISYEVAQDSVTLACEPNALVFAVGHPEGWLNGQPVALNPSAYFGERVYIPTDYLPLLGLSVDLDLGHGQAVLHAAGGDVLAVAPPDPFRDVMTLQGRSARGIYVTAPYIGHFGPDSLLDQMAQHGLNALVIDLKDDLGRVVYDTKLSAAEPSQVAFIHDLPGLIRTLHERGIYVIARVVTLKDSTLVRRRPDLAVVDTRSSAPWRDHIGAGWLDPYSSEAGDYVIALAKEMADLGADEIQFDYIRFPTDGNLSVMRFPHADTRSRSAAIADFLRRADKVLPVPISVDTFGVTAWYTNDRFLLGQVLEEMAPYLEAASPMLYSSHFEPSFLNRVPELRAFRIVSGSVGNLRQRLGPGMVLRPFLQAFSYNEPSFGPQYIRDQIAAVAAAGGDGFLFWNQRVQYNVLFNGITGRADLVAGLVQEPGG